MNEADRSFIIRVFGYGLLLWGSGMLAVLLLGLFNPAVDNNEIFKILGPIAQNVTTAAISIVSGLAGYKVGNSTRD
jgi:hypothetical protein